MDTQNNNMKKYPMSAQEATNYMTSAIDTKDDEELNLLVKHRFFDPAKHNDYNFAYEAINNGHIEIIKQLLEQGMSIDIINKRSDKTGLNLLHVACENRQNAIAKMLVKHKADVNLFTTGKYEVGTSCVAYSVFNKDKGLVRFLLENGADLDKDPNCFNMIDNAIKSCNSAMLTILLKRIKNINVVNEWNETFLHSCCWRCKPKQLDVRYKWAKYLIKNGADMNVRDARSGTTPIFDAVRHKFHRMSNLFLENNAYLHDIDNYGNNLLHYAVKYSDLEFIQTLLNQNVDVNHENKENKTPLAFAFEFSGYGQSQKIELLSKYMIKLKCSGFVFNQRDLNNVFEEKYHRLIDFDVEQFELDCKNEIEELKNEKIGTSGLSLYDILVKTDRSNAKYVRNETFKVLLTSEAVERKFPIYINLIRTQIRLAELRKNMLEMAKKYVVFTDLQKLPDVCVDGIFDKLSTLELNMFISVINPSIKVERSNLRAYDRV